eukprot:scaffold185672_cov44-Tisochrysis_lutea.AAC.1
MSTGEYVCSRDVFACERPSTSVSVSQAWFVSGFLSVMCATPSVVSRVRSSALGFSFPFSPSVAKAGTDRSCLSFFWLSAHARPGSPSRVRRVRKE